MKTKSATKNFSSAFFYLKTRILCFLFFFLSKMKFSWLKSHTKKKKKKKNTQICTFCCNSRLRTNENKCSVLNIIIGIVMFIIIIIIIIIITSIKDKTFKRKINSSSLFFSCRKQKEETEN